MSKVREATLSITAKTKSFAESLDALKTSLEAVGDEMEDKLTNVPFYRLRDLVNAGIDKNMLVYDTNANPRVATLDLLDYITTTAKHNGEFRTGYLLVDKDQRDQLGMEILTLSYEIANRKLLDYLDTDLDELEYNGFKVIWIKDLSRHYGRLYEERGGSPPLRMTNDSEILFCTDEDLTDCVIGSY